MWLIVDGYNVMKSTAFSDDYNFKELKSQRERFLNLLLDYKNSSKNKITVVFDGVKTDSVLQNSESFGTLDIKYSSGGVTADEVIKRLVEDSVNPKDILVVTSDKGISFYVKKCGASTVDANELYSKMQMKEEINELSDSAYFEKYVKGDIDSNRPVFTKQRSKKQKRGLKLW